MTDVSRETVGMWTMVTVEEAREFIAEHRSEGLECPVCDQHVKVYRRTINARMVRTLATMYAKAGLEYVHVPSLKVDDNHEVSQLGWRGLVEEERRERPDGGRAGYWRVTPHGEAWVHGRRDTPKYAVVYNGKLLEVTVLDRVRVDEVKGQGFDLRELLGR